MTRHHQTQPPRKDGALPSLLKLRQAVANTTHGSLHSPLFTEWGMRVHSCDVTSCHLTETVIGQTPA